VRPSFVKTINGYHIQFNRLLYPLHYCIKDNDPESDGMKYTFRKNDFGVWDAGQNDLPKWLDEMCLDIHYAIEDNEK